LDGGTVLFCSRLESVKSETETIAPSKNFLRRAATASFHRGKNAQKPGAEINNVKVTAESNNLLRVTASQSKQQKKTTDSGEMVTSEFGEYQQAVKLPGPARTKDMTVERKEHEVVITIPKKK
jgi:hypothetical protein